MPQFFINDSLISVPDGKGWTSFYSSGGNVSASFYDDANGIVNPIAAWTFSDSTALSLF
jgi:hypothetical protein